MNPLLLLALLPAAAPATPAYDFAARDAAGHTHRMSDWRDRKSLVVVFLSVDCPLAKLYAPRLNALANQYRSKGVAFVAVAPNRQDSPAALARFVKQHDLAFPFLKDSSGSIATRFDAERSPEAFVLDRARRVVYRGRIDDQYGVGVHKPRAAKQELVDALEAVLAGNPVSVAVTKAPGCPLQRAGRRVEPKGITYTKDVAAILQRRCQHCHRPGQMAPFALTTYSQAFDWADPIRENVENGRMPPWGANRKHGRFANDPSLTEQEKATLLGWIDSGCPEGDPRDLPPAPRFSDRWSIPGPDLILSMPKPFAVPAEGAIEYQYIRVDPGFTEDRWVSAAEVLPGNRAVLHHCNVFLQPPGRPDPEDLSEAGKLGSYCLAITALGMPPMRLPPGHAKRIPAGWKLVFVLHYQAIGSPQTDTTRLGLTFLDRSEVKKEVATKLMYEPNLRIPPRASNHVVSQTWEARRDMLLLSFSPHMHLRGKSFRYELIHPDGREEILLDVPRFDFAWQHRYDLAEPIRLRRGSRLRTTAVYDNSADNPANPDPDAEVGTGTQSWEEMYNGYFDVVLEGEDLTRPTPWYESVWQAVAATCRPGVALLACVAGGLYLGRKRLAAALQREA